MAWSIEGSYDPIVWTIVRANLQGMLLKDLRHLFSHAGIRVPGGARRQRQDYLIDFALECIEATDTSDNGGWAFWLDAEGYSSVETTLSEEGFKALDAEQRESLEIYAPEQLAPYIEEKVS